MAERFTYSIIKGLPVGEHESAMDAGCSALPGERPKGTRWGEWQPAVANREICWISAGDLIVIGVDAWRLAQVIAMHHSVMWLELRVQEGDHWDFTLYRATQIIADFSTRVGAFGSPESPRPWKVGDLASFAKAWGIDSAAVAPYLIDWDSLSAPVRVRPEDRHETHNWCQVYDFAKVLGIEEPMAHPKRNALRIAEWTTAQIRQPRWRRAVCRASVLLRGSYPDMPPLPWKERWVRYQQRRAALRVIRYGGMFEED